MIAFSHLKKVLIMFLAIFIVIFSLSAPYSTGNIDKLAYVIALGLDVGDNNDLKLSVQLSKPDNSSGGSSGNSYEEITNAVNCSSIDEGISLLNSYISRRINLSHCKVLVISEELASKGISDYIYTLFNNTGMSAHASMIVSKIPAYEFLDISKPELESLLSGYYESSLVSNEYTAYIQNVSLIKFFSDSVDSFTQPVAVLGSMSNLPIQSSNNTEKMGLAVFKYDKLVGELTGLETICHMIVSNELKSCTISIPNPLGDSETINLIIKLNNNCKNGVDIVNGTPHISSKIKINAKITSTTKESTDDSTNYYKKENTELIESACNEYLEKNIINYLYKTSKNYQSDIDGFGKYAVKYFYTLQDWEEYNWLENYHNSIFNVEVETTLKSGYSFL